MGWIGIIRIGLIQLALGAIVVLTTSTLNRVMVVELALPAMLPGALVGLHYAIQVLRPRWGYGSDVGGRRTPWIIGGMLVLAAGGILAAYATALMATNTALGISLAICAFIIIGCGVGAAGRLCPGLPHHRPRCLLGIHQPGNGRDGLGQQRRRSIGLGHRRSGQRADPSHLHRPLDRRHGCHGRRSL